MMLYDMHMSDFIKTKLHTANRLIRYLDEDSRNNFRSFMLTDKSGKSFPGVRGGETVEWFQYLEFEPKHSYYPHQWLAPKSRGVLPYPPGELSILQVILGASRVNLDPSKAMDLCRDLIYEYNGHLEVPEHVKVGSPDYAWRMSVADCVRNTKGKNTHKSILPNIDLDTYFDCLEDSYLEFSMEDYLDLIGDLYRRKVYLINMTSLGQCIINAGASAFETPKDHMLDLCQGLKVNHLIHYLISRMNGQDYDFLRYKIDEVLHIKKILDRIRVASKDKALKKYISSSIS